MSIGLTVNGKPFKVDLSDLPVDISLNTFIREHAKLSGTKFMCLEGGCGVCVVTVTGHHPTTKKMKTWATNSCLTLLSLCDGWEITTIEGLGNKKDGYHPIQKKLAEMNGTQCGYCSPAMIMNMYGLLKANGGKVTLDEVENSFGGNLCRCTGYRPILDAMKSFANESFSLQDIEDLSARCPKTGKACAGKCTKTNMKEICSKDGGKWFFPKNLEDCFTALDAVKGKPYMLVAGNTAHGVYRRSEDIQNFIAINDIDVLQQHEIGENLVLGGNLSLTEAMDIFKKVSSTSGFQYCQVLYDHFDLIANVPVRNMGTLAGNLMIKHQNKEFPSDIYITFKALDVQVNVMFDKTTTKKLSLDELYKTDMSGKLILSFELPKYDKESYRFDSFKIMPRAQNAHAYVNAAFLVKLSQTKVEKVSLCFGGINPTFNHAFETQKFIVGKDLSNEETTDEMFKTLSSELKADWIMPDASSDYRERLASGLLYKFILSVLPKDKVKESYQSGGEKLKRILSSGSQVFDVIEKNFPLNQPVMKHEALPQCSGEAIYSNDIAPLNDQVFCAFVHGTVVGGEIQKIDATEALKIPGVVAFYSAKDIPGTNSFVYKSLGFTDDEEIFASKTILYHDQPIGMIVAENSDLANRAAKKVDVMYTRSSKKIMSTLQEVLESKDHSRILDVSVSQVKDYVPAAEGINVKGIFDMGTQYHFFMEPQTTVCIPFEDGLKVYSATQWMDLNQVTIASMLNVHQNSVHVVVRRLGGGYGGKISRGTQVSCACALAAHLLNRPARFVQTIESMMGSMGKRYPNNSNYEVKVNQNGKILSLQNTFYEDCGWSTNENPINFHSTLMARNCYEKTDSWKIDGKAVLTDAASNTWCRAPGSVEGVAMMENIIEHIAAETGKDPIEVRLANIAPDNKMKELLQSFVKSTGFRTRESEIKKFNEANRWRKKGISVSVMEYPIFYFGMYTATVAVYHSDGTVLISHGGIEMGQGLNTKVAQVAAYTLGIPLEFISVIQSDSFNGANSMVTGGAVGSESLSFAVKKCCEILLERLKPIRAELKNPSWRDITKKAIEKKVNLVVSDEYKEGDLKPYLIWGCCATEVEVDILTGNVIVQRVDILEDTGESLSPNVDIGQIEGAFIMGLGYWLTEHTVFNKQTGELLTNRTWSYKVPGAKDIPVDFRIEMLQKSSNSGGLLRSKATGEPAVCLSVSVLFAIRRAIESARKDAGLKGNWLRLESPLTPEVIMLASGVSPTTMFKLG